MRGVLGGAGELASRPGQRSGRVALQRQRPRRQHPGAIARDAGGAGRIVIDAAQLPAQAFDLRDALVPGQRAVAHLRPPLIF